MAHAALDFPSGWTKPLDTITQNAGWLDGCGDATGYDNDVFHLGVDLNAELGTPVQSIGAGTVVWLRPDPTWGTTDGEANAGLWVRYAADDGTPFILVYGHIQVASGVVEGATIAAGQRLGTVGDYFGHPHLHVGLHEGGDVAAVPKQHWGRMPCGPGGDKSDHNGFSDPFAFLTAHPPYLQIGSRARSGTLSTLLDADSATSNARLFWPGNTSMSGLQSTVPGKVAVEVGSADNGMAIRFSDGTASRWSEFNNQLAGPYDMQTSADAPGAIGLVTGGGAVTNASRTVLYHWPAGAHFNQVPISGDLGNRYVELRSSSPVTMIARTDTGKILLGAGSTGGQVLGPRSVPDLLTGATVVSVDSRDNVDAAVTSDGRVVVWDQDGVKPVPSTLCSARVVRLPGTVVCRDGTVQVWDAGRNDELVPPPAGLKGVVDVAAGRGYWMARTAKGTLVSWGAGAPYVPAGLSGVSAISAGVAGVVVTTGGVTTSTVWQRPDKRFQVRWSPPPASAGTVRRYEVRVGPDSDWRPVGSSLRSYTSDDITVVRGQFPAVRALLVTDTGVQPGPEVAAVLIDRPVKYAALGDSFSSGEGNPPYLNGSVRADGTGCHRSSSSYGAALTRRLGGGGLVDLTFVPCSGALSRDVLYTNVQHSDEEAQLSKVPTDADLVTLTLGGNDVGFPQFVRSCLKVTVVVFDQSPGDCQGVDQATVVQPGDEEAHLLYVLERIRARAPKARLVVLGYPQVISDPASWDSDELKIPVTGTAWVDHGTLSKENGTYLYDILGPALNQHVKAAAAAVGAEFVDEYDAFAGHELGTEDPWVTPVRADTLQESIHPTAAGQERMAGRITGAVLDGGASPATLPKVVEPLRLRMVSADDHIRSDYPESSATVPVGATLYSCVDSYLATARVPLQLQRLRKTGWEVVKTSYAVVSRSGTRWSMDAADWWSSKVNARDPAPAQLLTARACWPVNTTVPFSGTFRWVRPAQGRLSEVATAPFAVTVS